MSRAEAGAACADAESCERERRRQAFSRAAYDARQLAASASPRIGPDRSAIVKELQRLRSFEAHRKMQALALDVELIDHIIELLDHS